MIPMARFLIAFAAFSVLAADPEHITVWRDETMYYICPWLSRLPNGDLAVTVREAHRRRPDQMGHVDPTARGVMIRSKDGGRTWGGKTVVDDETYRFSQTEDVPWTPLSNGSLFLNLYAWTISPYPMGAEPEGTRPYAWSFEGSYGMRSADGGKTWSRRKPIRVDKLPRIGSRVPATELPDGELVLPVYGSVRQGEETSAWLIRSKDKGETWGEVALIGSGPALGARLDEPFVLRKKDGSMIAMIRTGGYLWQSDSRDNGRTWTTPAATKIWGFPAFLKELADGRILCIYGYRRAPFGLRWSTSSDGGRTWDVANEKILRDDGGNGDLGYPSVVDVGGGRLLVVYWMNHQKEGAPDSDVRYVAGTFFQP